MSPTPNSFLPKNSPIPNQAFYPVVPTLWNFDRYPTRAACLKEGFQAGPFNSDRHKKTWRDATDFAALGLPYAVYEYYDRASNSFKTMVMLPEEAASLNLPGAYQYPAYVKEPTPATCTSTITGAVSPLPLNGLSFLEDAKAIAAEIGAGDPVEKQFNTTSPFTIQWNGETRRLYWIRWQGSDQEVSALVNLKNEFGVGAPGEWDTSDVRNGLRWERLTPDLGLSDTRPEIPMPVRARYKNPDGSPLEELTSEIFSPFIYRTDMPSVFNKGSV